ncbi:hypothetical protein [Chryseobacterium sp. T20]|uniref:hypothetical protein n=1 Tax=Chryseobacterium sp. T20 TaxID=3395375 RepID=UPI0039BD6FDB
MITCSVGFSITSYAQNKIEKMETKTEITTLIKNHFDIINSPGSKDRIALMEKTYSPDFHIIDTHFEKFGIPEFDKTIDEIHQKLPGKKFMITEDIIVLNNAAKAVWKLGDTFVGEDIFLFHNGKISTIVAFVKSVEDSKK